MEVIKRDGTTEPFDERKVYNAIEKAMIATKGEDVDSGFIENITQDVAAKLNKIKDDIHVEDIQDIVEEKLMASRYKDVARNFINYRQLHKLARDNYAELMQAIEEKLSAQNVMNQNANVDEKSFGGRVGEASDLVMKKYALDFLVSSMSKANHENNEIYIHDLNSYAVGSHNCLSIPFDDLLAKGFNTRQTDIRPAQSVSTAFQLVAVIFQLQSLQQFGGVSATHLDWTMVPYVRKSFRKHYIDGLKYIENISDEELFDHIPNDAGIEDGEYKIYTKAYQYAMDMTTKEVYQAVEGMYHNLNCIRAA